APVVNGLLFLAIFSLALGDHMENYVGGLPFAQFVAPGLIMMSVVQNAFANSSSSLTMGKVMGTIIDYLMPPLSPFEITTGMVLAALTRGVLVGILVSAAVWVFIPITLV